MTVLLHSGDDKKIEQLFYANEHSLMTGQSGPNMQMMYEELCTFVDLHGGN
jgi:hypothetical protein